VDYREENRNVELMPHFKQIGVTSEKADLVFGDFMFEGKGPHGTVSIGIERKRLHDMLHCIDDARLSGHQLVGMKQMYDVRVLLLEGHWKPHEPQGVLMEGFHGGMNWGYCRYRSQRTMYSKLYRYLISVAMSGVIITHSRDLWHSAFNICEWYHYFQKPWQNHTSFQEIQKIAIPTMHGKPKLVRLWANAIEGIGTKLSQDAERIFRTPLALANADEEDWLRIPGVGVKTAQQIVKEVWGVKR
jgi:ERCC4-type nuclease